MMLRAWAQPLPSKLSPPVRRKPLRRPARRPRPSARPGLESLEDRVVPNNARLLWVRDAMVNPAWWNLTSNWRDFATGAIPASVDATDTLVFDPNQMVGGTAGSNADGTDNLNFVPLAGLDVEGAYTGAITLNQDLTVTGSATFADGGRIQGPRSFTIGSGATFTWSGGEFLNLNVTLWSGSTTGLTGAAQKSLTGNLTNFGTVTWTGTGAIGLDGTFTNRAGAFFDIQNDASMAALFGGHASIVNQGLFQKSTGAAGAQTSIGTADFDNQGQFKVLAGAVQLLGGTDKQSAAGATTVLADGTTLEMAGPASTFLIQAGTFYSGNAVFEGTLSNGDPALPGSGGTLHLGLSSGNPATLTVLGEYDQKAGGTLYVEVTNAGIGLLQVQAGGGLPGNANVAGTVTFHRDPSQTPSGAPRTFLTAVAINGLFNAPPNSDPVNDSWIVANKTVKFKSAQPNAGGTAYLVTIG